MINIQAINVPFEVSDNNGATWQTLVCVNEHTLPVQSAVNKVNTQCGVAAGLGPIEFNPTFQAVTTTDEIAGAQLTYKQVLAYTVAQTRLKYRLQVSDTSGSIGNIHYLSGFGYFTDVTLTETVGDVEKFSGNFTGIGTPSIIPGS